MNKKTKDKIAKDFNLKSPVVISEGTLVPISSVITFIGFVVWLTSPAVPASPNGNAVLEVVHQETKVAVAISNVKPQ